MHNEKSGFVYLWFDRKHKRFYIGAHWGHEDDGYVCSSRWMKKAYKIRPDDFRRRIIARGFTDKASMFAEEYKFLARIKPEEIKVRYYNLHIAMKTHWSSTPEAKSIAKKSGDARRGKSLGPCSEETKQKISAANSGKVRSDETKQLLRDIKTGTTLSEETRQRIAANHISKRPDYIHHSKKPGYISPLRKTNNCVICGMPTGSPRRLTCSKEHRYEAMKNTMTA